MYTFYKIQPFRTRWHSCSTLESLDRVWLQIRIPNPIKSPSMPTLTRSCPPQHCLWPCAGLYPSPRCSDSGPLNNFAKCTPMLIGSIYTVSKQMPTRPTTNFEAKIVVSATYTSRPTVQLSFHEYYWERLIFCCNWTGNAHQDVIAVPEFTRRSIVRVWIDKTCLLSGPRDWIVL